MATQFTHGDPKAAYIMFLKGIISEGKSIYRLLVPLLMMSQNILKIMRTFFTRFKIVFIVTYTL